MSWLSGLGRGEWVSKEGYQGPERREPSPVLPVLLVVIAAGIFGALIAAIVLAINQGDIIDTQNQIIDKIHTKQLQARESEHATCLRQNDARRAYLRFVLTEARKDYALATAVSEPPGLKKIRLHYAALERDQAEAIVHAQASVARYPHAHTLLRRSINDCAIVAPVPGRNPVAGPPLDRN